jgi:DNA excision repair protein ERCC-3
MYHPERPVIVQSDRTLLLEVHNEGYEAARDALARFAELERSPEHLHTYRLTALSLWNAAATGLGSEQILELLGAHSKYALPPNVITDIRELCARFGQLWLLPNEHGDPRTLVLAVASRVLADELAATDDLRLLLSRRVDPTTFEVPLLARGELKQRLTRLGRPVDDRAGFSAGAPLELSLRSHSVHDGKAFEPRSYQRDAASAFAGGPAGGAGHGVVVLPCGAGKTIVALEVMAKLKTRALVLATNVTAVHQWIAEILDKTTLTRDEVGEYTGDTKELRPVTVATYQLLTHRTGDAFTHFEKFLAEPFGLLVYDEVHLLPAPVFRLTAALQARRRLGLTATLVREDGRADDVFSLIGPKRYDVPWKEMEEQGWIAAASCHELRVELPPTDAVRYAAARARERHKIAAENLRKVEVVKALVEHHEGELTLVIGQFLEQLDVLGRSLNAPVLTGRTPQKERERLFAEFRAGRVPVLVVSKVANFSIDLPDASVCIQVSGTFGSRQEEAQRLGRILRPKKKHAYFYTLVTRDSCELDFAMNRQLFLTEQGYRYSIEDWRGKEATRLPMAHRDRQSGAEVIDLALERRRRERLRG